MFMFTKLLLRIILLFVDLFYIVFRLFVHKLVLVQQRNIVRRFVMKMFRLYREIYYFSDMWLWVKLSVKVLLILIVLLVVIGVDWIFLKFCIWSNKIFKLSLLLRCSSFVLVSFFILNFKDFVSKYINYFVPVVD